ncbi:RDD family protein [[Mycobacterium] wendilense]|uniref:RDD family protein n=1 Tax=[Mycobacterium] wendilense TaxID=3064284 RepID=A0ABM9MJG1_9MYCO|nr:RDD family protein [Mycolicibacterium sp. MU0050]CAJ1586508.1 RDD family protein [Mycolicibacterium sp. MU0050]
MTELLTDDTRQSDTETTDPSSLASWPARAGAFALDVVVGFGVFAALVLVAWSTPQREWLWWVTVLGAAAVLLAVAVNRMLLPALSGWTLGRALFGIAVVDRDGTKVGPWRLLARDAAHLIDTAALLLGWFWPLWDRRNRTVADMVARTEVRVVEPTPRHAKKTVVKVVSLGAAIAVAAATLGYLTVYRQDLRLAQTREQLAVQGPKLVTDMLSYQAATLHEDFERARGAVTDNYRPQLEEQQRAIEQAGAVDNDYWSPNAAVLTAGADRGTMLVLLQGQRGTPPDYRTITATVKVEFVRAAADQWKVDNLTVLASPNPAGGGG